MENQHQEFPQTLAAKAAEICARVEEVGLEQASDEYWQEATEKLTVWCAEQEEQRRLNNTSPSEP